MEEAFKRQALELEDIVHQNRELGDCLERLELVQDQRYVELRGRIEVLQVHLFL